MCRYARYIRAPPTLPSRHASPAHQVGDGNFTIALRPDWAPHGVKRVVAMAERDFFTDLPFFRILSGFLIQFGISPDRIKNEYWRAQGTIQDDTPIGVPFTDGVVSFAGYSKDSRTTHLLCAPVLAPSPPHPLTATLARAASPWATRALASASGRGRWPSASWWAGRT